MTVLIPHVCIENKAETERNFKIHVFPLYVLEFKIFYACQALGNFMAPIYQVHPVFMWIPSLHVSATSLCSNGNGGCTQLCFPRPQYNMTGIKVSKQNRTCGCNGTSFKIPTASGTTEHCNCGAKDMKINGVCVPANQTTGQKECCCSPSNCWFNRMAMTHWCRILREKGIKLFCIGSVIKLWWHGMVTY